jgi:hypothetical protein
LLNTEYRELREGSVQLTSSLRQLVLRGRKLFLH